MQGGSLVTAFLHPKVITRLSRNKNEILIKKERYYCFEIAHNVSQIHAGREFPDELPTKYCFSIY